jgi:hypothetical protein
MGNRLNLSFIINLSAETPESILNELKEAGENEYSRFGFMCNNFNYCDGKQVFSLSVYKDNERKLYSGRHDDCYWLEVHTCFKNYNQEFEEFWKYIKPYLIPHNGLNNPVGHFWNDNSMGLIMLEGLKKISPQDLK